MITSQYLTSTNKSSNNKEIATLSPRQLLTIKHLREKGIKKPLDIIKYCVEVINKPHCSQKSIKRGLKRPDTRKRSKRYYQEIINYLAQNNLPPDTVTVSSP